LQCAGRLAATQVSYLQHVRQVDADIATTNDLTQDFLPMVREHRGERLDDWIEMAAEGKAAEATLS